MACVYTPLLSNASSNKQGAIVQKPDTIITADPKGGHTHFEVKLMDIYTYLPKIGGFTGFWLLLTLDQRSKPLCVTDN